MTHEIAEQAPDLGELALVGIQRGGVELAARLAGLFEHVLLGQAAHRGHRHHLLSRRHRHPPGQGVRAAEGPLHRSALRRQRQDHRAGGRRALHGPDHPGGHRRAVRLRTPACGAPGGAGRPRATATCPSGPTSWARTCPPAATSRWWSTWWRPTASTRWSSRSSARPARPGERLVAERRCWSRRPRRDTIPSRR